jgi:hypothetical protein
MARSIPTTIVEALNAASTGEAFLVLVEFTHSTFDTQRVVNNTEDIVSNGDTYLRFPFSIIAPPDTDEFQPRIQIAVMDAVGEFVTDFRSVAGSRERIFATVTIIAADDPDTALAQWSDFEVVNVDYNADVLRADLVVENFLSEPYPGDTMNPAQFPGLF